MTEVAFWTTSLNTPELCAYLDAFETTYTEYSLAFTRYASEDYKTLIRVAVAGGNAPGVFQTNEGAIDAAADVAWRVSGQKIGRIKRRSRDEVRAIYEACTAPY
ncbi:MAG: hypothetical protein EA383_02620 [Spirochaetaceae bacterium]|nr:MAG: hypothetical protein EA383_02620 [Spirochaetaceae bacterium]